MSFLELRNISKSYGVGSTLVHALVDASLSVDRGNLVAVMGPSGSGQVDASSRSPAASKSRRAATC